MNHNDVGGYNKYEGPTIPSAYRNVLEWDYGLGEKRRPYVSHPYWTPRFKQGSEQWLNTLAVFSQADTGQSMHGTIGRFPNGTDSWRPLRPMPPPFTQLDEGSKKRALKDGGFYLQLSNALPLSRAVPDSRESVCKNVHYNYENLGSASIIITYFNEPLSTLLRTVHSILNYTPPPLLREIILVDDHSTLDENLPGGPLYSQIEYLPKVKLMRVAERRGIVHARLAGARAARGNVLVVLDSHVEVNPEWLEPMMARIAENRKVLVFPQILGLSHENFDYKPNSGIGCQVSWRWAIVEQASLTGKVTKPDLIPSSSMAGGLFAMDLEFFWELGGYDEGFIAWGAENVEMAFRIWMCGGRVECAPCSRTYHIYRKGGTGYTNPAGALWHNRRRTAKVWMGEYEEMASRFIDVSTSHSTRADFGDVSKMLKLKHDLQCKDFHWFLKNVDPLHDTQELSDIVSIGRLQSNGTCLDLMGGRTPGATVRTYPCQAASTANGNQAFFISKDDKRIRMMANDKRCIGIANDNKLVHLVACNDVNKAAHWQIDVLDETSNLVHLKMKWKNRFCITLDPGSSQVGVRECGDDSPEIFYGDRYQKTHLPLAPLRLRRSPHISSKDNNTMYLD